MKRTSGLNRKRTLVAGLVAGGVGALGLGRSAQADAYPFGFNYDFSSISTTDMANWWTTNGSAYLHNGTDPGSPNQRLRITASSVGNNGSAWDAVPAGQNNVPNWCIFPQQAWSVSMTGQFSYQNGNGGDGMALVLQTAGTSAMQANHFSWNVPSETAALGNYLAFNLSTYQGPNDLSNNDLQVFTSNYGMSPDIILPDNSLHNGQPFTLTATYTPGDLFVTFANPSLGSAAYDQIDIGINLADTFGSGGAILGFTGVTGAAHENQDVTSLVVNNATAIYCAHYHLTAAVSGGALANGRLTQGQTCTETAYTNNSVGYQGDAMNYSGLSMTGSAGITNGSNTSGNLPYSDWGANAGTFTATTLGQNTLSVHVDGVSNATMGGSAAFDGNTTATVYVDALTEHVNAANITDTGNASTTPTAFYRQNASWGGQNLGSVTVTKATAGSYGPAFVNNINGGSGTAVGTLTINVSGSDSRFGSDPSIIMLGFQNVNHLGTGSGSLTTIEGALTTAGIEWRDYTGTNNNWPTMTNGLDPLTGTNQFQNVADYDLELAFNDGSLTSSQSYFDFNFTDQLGTAGDVVNIAVVPEPASVSLLLLGGTSLLARRRRRAA